MNKNIALLLLPVLLCQVKINAQYATRPDVKVYGYSQITLPGNIPVERDEQGNRLPGKPFTPEPSYFIYITGKTGIKVTGLYIKGKSYGIQQEKLSRTPVYEERPGLPAGKKQKVLVPKSSATAFRLGVAGEESNEPLAASLKKQITQSELVIVYTLNGKKYRVTQKKIIVLEPVAAY